MSTPDPTPQNTLPDETIDKVKQIYENDLVSRQMGGKKDCVSMIVNGVKQKVQKQMLLCTEYEAFLKFSEDNPDVEIASSKFAEHKTKNVVLPVSSGTPSVCVCIYHQNPKLMLVNSQITSKQVFKKIAGSGEGNKFMGQLTYNHLLVKLM